ncbi:type II toxin-antitoxin system HicA family toxin [Nocardiopsis synnemataformans]
MYSTRGDHAKLRKDSRVVIVPMHKELKRGTLNSILTQAGLGLEELRSLL